MTVSEDQRRAAGFAEAAVKAMAAYDIPPTPQNYSLWYAHVSGALPDLSHTIGILVSNQQAFTPELCAELYNRYFDAGGHFRLLQDTGGRLHDVVDRVRRYIGVATGDTSSFGQTLDDFSSALGRGIGRDEMRALLADLIGETQAMAQRNKTLEDQLNQAVGEVTQLRQSLEVVQREALTDALTGIPNRKCFETRLREAAQEAIVTGETLSVLIADIDHFKRFNDTYGHQLGDQVLKLVARTLMKSVKGRDTPARYGGEEFAIVLPQTRLKDAGVVADQIRQTITRHKLVGKESGDDYGVITLSFGASQYRPGEPLGDFVRRADAALYHAKRSGRNRVSTEEMVDLERLS